MRIFEEQMDALLDVGPARELGVTEVHRLAPFGLDFLVILHGLIRPLSR